MKNQYSFSGISAVLLLFFVSACEQEQQEETFNHPDSISWDEIQSVSFVDFRTVDTAGDEVASSFHYVSSDADFRLASLPTPETVLPLKSLIDADGNVLLRNSKENKIDVYTEDGELVYSIDEVGLLMGFAMSPDRETLYVLDSSITHIHEKNDGRFERSGSFEHGLVMATGICATNDSVFMSGQGMMPDDAKRVASEEVTPSELEQFQGPVTVYSRGSYDFERTFGRAIESGLGQGVNAAFMSESHLACLPEHDTIVTFNKHFGQIDAYSFDGQRRWTVVLENFKEMRFREHSVYGISPVEPYVSQTNLHSIQAIDEQPYVVLGFTDTVSNANGSQVSFKTMLLDARDGQLMQISQDDGVVTSLSSNSAITQRFTADGTIEVILSRDES